MPQGSGELLNARYRSLSGFVYDAQINTSNADGTFDIDVVLPGTAVRVPLRKIRRGTELGQLLEGA